MRGKHEVGPRQQAATAAPAAATAGEEGTRSQLAPTALTGQGLQVPYRCA